MNWQTTLALAVVALTLLVFLVRLAKPRSSGSCGHDCQCDHPKPPGKDSPPHSHDHS